MYEKVVYMQDHNSVIQFLILSGGTKNYADLFTFSSLCLSSIFFFAINSRICLGFNTVVGSDAIGSPPISFSG